MEFNRVVKLCHFCVRGKFSCREYHLGKFHLENSLSDAKYKIEYLQQTINELQIEKQRYKDDCNLAVRLLHQYPNEFISIASTKIQDQIKNRFELV